MQKLPLASKNKTLGPKVGVYSPIFLLFLGLQLYMMHTADISDYKPVRGTTSLASVDRLWAT